MTLARFDVQGDRVVIVNMNTTRRGALSDDLYEAIQDGIAAANAPEIRSVIVTAEGGYFCAGGNLNLLRERRTMTEQARRQAVDDGLHASIRAIRSSPVPVIAAVEGGAAGAGLSIALACDMIVAAEDAQFLAAYVRAGLVPDGGLTASMARILPRPIAMEMCVMGRSVGASRMADLGAINQVVAKGAAEAAAHRYADALAKGPRQAQGVIRAMVNDAYGTSEEAQLDRERDAMAHAAGGGEAAEGIAAFLEKRKPDFS
ncbi:oxepin-CoA hydrolase, alternative type [Falsiphaeobacter marinintestinus]|uniref:oxepin-CoA hydrolase, alternative type n=1 Tax=Falsiphaeobacter marinintestinus TaxID=1492905 RepID=UPI0011B3E027|nr:enoyl-CoA hydratase family protein [Phaeobacter marinintestinus]